MFMHMYIKPGWLPVFHGSFLSLFIMYVYIRACSVFIHMYMYILHITRKSIIRESRLSDNTDGTNTPIVCVHTKAF